MPWHIERSESCPASHPWAVIKDADGQTEGCHANREMAEDHMKALYAGEEKKRGGMNRSWYSIKNQTADTAEVWLYDEVGKFGVTAAEFVNDLNNIKAPSLDIRVNSPGGEVFDGMAIYSAIRNHPAKVTVHIDGLAASAASFIAMAGDHIKAERTATLMIHDGMGIAAGNSKDMRNLAALLDKCSDNIASIYAERAGGTVDEWRERMRAETWYTAAEAKSAGLVDEIVTGKSRITNSVAWDLSLFRYAGRDDAPAPGNHAPPIDPPDEPVAPAGSQSVGIVPLPDIRDGVEAAQDIPFDATRFRLAIDLAAADRAELVAQPEVPEPAEAPVPPDDPVAPVVDDPPDEAGFLMPDIRDTFAAMQRIPWDPDLFRAAVHLAAGDSPAPDTPAPTPQPAEPESITVPDFRRAIREGQL